MKKVEITRERLTELYVDKQLTMFEIAEIYNVNRTTIANRLKEYEIDSNPSQRKYKILKAIPLLKEQKELIVGSILGDASLIRSGRRINTYFKISHCEKQKEYLFWKKAILGNLVNSIAKMIDKRGNSIMYGFNTLSHHELNFYRDLFYENNKKVINKDIGLYLTPLGLATWFMDDGSKDCNNVSYRLSTDGFSKEDNYNLKFILKSNFDLNVKVCEYEKHQKKYYYLSINKRNSAIMTDIISPYIVDCMKYKLVTVPQRLHAKLPQGGDDDIV
jgi:predicted DNA-binding protein YlxM (UPF0122 family)